MSKVISEPAYETQQLVERLKKAVNEEDYSVVPYSELSHLCGADVQAEGRGYLTSARRIVERETGRLVDCVRTEGIKLLDETEQASLAPDTIQRVKRLSRRRLGRLAKVQREKLSDSDRIAVNTVASILGAIQLFTRAKSIEKIGGAVQQSDGKLPTGDTLKLFSANGKKENGS